MMENECITSQGLDTGLQLKTIVFFFSYYAPVPNRGGVERVVFNLKNALNKSEKYMVYSLSIDSGENLENHFYLPPHNFSRILKALIEKMQVKILICHVNIGLNIVNEVKKLDCKNLHIYHHHHGIVATPEYCFSLTVHSAKNTSGIAKIIKILFFPLYFCYILLNAYRGFLNGVKNSEGYILLSSYFKSDLLRLPGIKKYENKIFSMTNPHVFSTDGYKRYDKEKLVLFVGRIHYHDKNIPALLDIWKRIEKQNTEYTLCIVGDGADRKRLEKDIARLGLKHVRLEGMQKNVADYYKKASFLFLTSQEGWGLVLVEAMEYGCIPFAFDSYSSAKEIILDKKNGFLVPPKNNALYADTALASFSMEEKELEPMRKTGYEHIKQFDVETVAARWEAFFDEVLA